MKARDLTVADIGSRFKFCGEPEVTGVLVEITEADEYSSKVRINDTDEDDDWADRYGYWIDADDSVVPVDEPKRKPSDPVREKLAAYIRDEYSSRSHEGVFGFNSNLMADIFTELMEGRPDA